MVLGTWNCYFAHKSDWEASLLRGAILSLEKLLFSLQIGLFGHIYGVQISTVCSSHPDSLLVVIA